MSCHLEQMSYWFFHFSSGFLQTGIVVAFRYTSVVFSYNKKYKII